MRTALNQHVHHGCIPTNDSHVQGCQTQWSDTIVNRGVAKPDTQHARHKRLIDWGCGRRCGGGGQGRKMGEGGGGHHESRLALIFQH